MRRGDRANYVAESANSDYREPDLPARSTKDQSQIERLDDLGCK